MKINMNFLMMDICIMGLTIAREFKKKFPNKIILMIEKEKSVTYCSSGKNSNILDASYYMLNSLKVKCTIKGNKLLRAYYKEFNSIKKLNYV